MSENRPIGQAKPFANGRVSRFFEAADRGEGPSVKVGEAETGRASFRSARQHRSSGADNAFSVDDVYVLQKHQMTADGHSEGNGFVHDITPETRTETPEPATTRRPMTSTLSIYTRHFGLKARPFSLLPDPDFLFWSSEHRRAFTMLEYGILTCAPITLITGEVGSGKTTILRHLLNNIEEGIKVGLVSNAHGDRGELLRWVLMALDQPTAGATNYVDLFDQFQTYLIEEYARGNRVVIIFDEAQNLSREALEELRMFTNINANKDELLQLVLVGQPELRDIIRRPDLRQFAQRVAASFHIGPMDAATVQAYIGHRLARAGAPRNLFNRHACDIVFANTGGVPRLVNQLCDLSMVYAFTNNQKTVTDRIVQQVLDDGAFFGAGAFDAQDHRN